MKTDQKQQDSIETSVAVILTKVNYIEAEVRDIRSKLEKEYVTQDQFEPIRKVVYGLVSITLLSVVGAVIALVLRK